MVGGGNPLLPKILCQPAPIFSEITDFEQIFARSASAVTHSKKSSINANRKFTMRFPISLRWSSYVTPKPPKGGGGWKRKTAVFGIKSHFAWKKVCYRVSLCEICQQQSCKAFIGLTVRAKMIGGGDPFYLKFFADFLSVFARSPSALTPSEKKFN